MRLALTLCAAFLLAGCSTLEHKAVEVDGNQTTGAGVQLNRNGLTLNGVVKYRSTTPEIERERRLAAEAAARKAEAELELAKLRGE